MSSSVVHGRATVVRGGRLVSGTGLQDADLLLKGGVIAAVLKPGETVADARHQDASGCLIMPGLVDAHVHLREPGLTHKEDFFTGTTAAIAGGVTTVLVMPTDDPWTDSPVHLQEKKQLAEGRIWCDVGLQVAVTKTALCDLSALRNLGACSFEVFTFDVPEKYLHDTAAALDRAIAAVKDVQGLAAVSAGNASILERYGAIYSNQDDACAYMASRPPASETIGVANVALLAARNQAPVHIRQISSTAAVDIFGRLKDQADLTIETSPQSLIFDASAYDLHGSLIKASPCLRTKEDVQSLRQAVRSGLLDIVCTDHSPHLLFEKTKAGIPFSKVPGGFPGVQTLLLSMLWLESQGHLSLTDIVRACAETPARRFGYGQRKGFLKPGYDADFVVLDPARSTTIRNEDMKSKSAYSVFAGFSIPYHLRQVYLHGRSVLNGTVLNGPSGKVLQ